MDKHELSDNEILPMIRKCYESDREHILKVHETSQHGLDFCINRTTADYILNNIKIYALEHNGEFVAYFGEQPDNWMTGFMILPKFRKSLKKQVWDSIVDHFDGEFKTGVYSKNPNASRFYLKQGCELVEKTTGAYGPCEIFEYKEVK